WSNSLLARFRSLISSATLVSSWAARVRATAACDRSCTTTRKPSATAITLTTISRWARAVPSAERLRILHQEGGIEGRQAEAGAAQPAEPQPVDPAAALELRELVGISGATPSAGRVAQGGDGLRDAWAGSIGDQDVGARVMGGGALPDASAVARVPRR